MQEQSKTVVATETAATTQRTITVVPTKGQNKKITYDGNDWIGLKAKLESEGFDLSNIKVVESIKKSTLEHPQAILPDGNFNLFLMPYKSKSGAKSAELSRTEAYTIIKKAKEKDGDKAQEHFGNHTNKSTADLNELIESYKPGARKTRRATKHEATADVVDSVKNATSKSEVFEHLDGLSVDEKLNVLVGVVLDLKANKPQEESKSKAVATAVPKESESERIAREAKENEARENQALQDELGGIAAGFTDVDIRKAVPVRR